MSQLVPTESIERRIFLIRGMKVMVDRDLAHLYRVPTKALNQAVKRNKGRFPEGFLFRLTRREMRQLVTACDRFRALKHSSRPALAFTEYGVAMLSSVLRSKRAIDMNIRIIQTFIRLRRLELTHDSLARKIGVLERRVGSHDERIETICDAIQELANPPKEERPKIGFKP